MNAFAACALQNFCAALIFGEAGYLMDHGKSGWGWLIFAGILMLCSVKTKTKTKNGGEA